jgi:hypothetical protein
LVTFEKELSVRRLLGRHCGLYGAFCPELVASRVTTVTSVEGVESVDNRPDIVDTFLSEFSLDSFEQRFCLESFWHGLAYQML